MHKLRAAFLLPATLAPRAWAHPGHGLPGDAHWHATDVAGLAVVIAAALVAWWLAGRK